MFVQLLLQFYLHRGSHCAEAKKMNMIWGGSLVFIFVDFENLCFLLFCAVTFLN